jgi:hypothetical protein
MGDLLWVTDLEWQVGKMKNPLSGIILAQFLVLSFLGLPFGGQES